MLGATTSLEVQTPEGVSFRLPIASPFSRCLAMAIDFAVILALTVLLFQILSILGNMLTHIPVIGRVVSDLSSGLLIILQFLIGIGYGIACEWLLRGQTVGKRMMKLRVIDERGLTLRFSQVAIRNLFRLLDILPSTFYLLGGISCFLTKRCQRLGDIAAGTLVVREVPVRPPALESLAQSRSNSFSRHPHLEARLRQNTSPTEARIALDALIRRDELAAEPRLTVFSRLAGHFREIVSFPEEDTIGLSDEQYVRNVVDSLFRRAGG
jgi:uncharacterized RDD family membrane protein YckC